MEAITEAPAKPKATLTDATQLLFCIAARSHSLADEFGIELDGDGRMTFQNVPRPWLVPKWKGSTELTFDADIYAKTVDDCSDYTRHMRLWILNVWNPSYAKSKGWHFDLFAALRGLDQGNTEAIAHWVKLNVWP